MKNSKKKIYAFLLIINMIIGTFTQCMAAWAAATPPPVKNNPDITTNVTYDTSIATPTTKYYVGDQVPFYANTVVSSVSTSYPGAYSLIYLDKSIFAWPSTSDISDYINMPTGGDAKSVTQQGDYYIMKIKYINAGSAMITIPFKATLKANGLVNGETYNIPIEFYKADGTLLATTHNNFVAYTYPIGTKNAILDTNTRSYLQGSSDLQSNTVLSNDTKTYIRVDSYRVEWPAPGTTLGGDTKSKGFDRRKTRITVQLPANTIWDTTISGNEKWTYNAANQTITKDELVTSNSDYSRFTMRYNNQPVGTSYSTPVKVEFPVTWQFVNDDGSLDPESLIKSKIVDSFYSYPGTPPRDDGFVFYKSGYENHILSTREESLHSYYLSTGWAYSGGNPNQLVTYGAYNHTVDKIIDEPVEGLELVKYAIRHDGRNIRVKNAAGAEEDLPVFDATQIANMQHNKLIGTLPGGTTEVIATNVAITSTETEITLPTPKQYTKLEFVFDTPIKFMAPTTTSSWSSYGEGVSIKYSFKLTENSYNTVKNTLSTMPSTGATTTKNNSSGIGDNGTSTKTQNGVQTTWSKEWASLRRADYPENAPRDAGLKYINQRVGHDSTLDYIGNLGSKWDLENLTYTVLADPGLKYNSSSYSYYTWGGDAPSGWVVNTTVLPDTYTTIQNYKGTGKTAYVHNISGLKLPNYTSSSAISRLEFYTDFTVTRNLDGGDHTISSIVNWSNNETAANHPVTGKDIDRLDVDNDGNTTERFAYMATKFKYSPPRELILTKRSKRADATLYSSVTTADSNQEVDYQLNIYNNSQRAEGGFTFLDILPYPGDKAIAPNSDGVTYDNRGSTFGVKMTGPLDANPNYIYQYSTDAPVNGNIAANYAANWVNTVADWSQVKMIKITMKPGYTLASGQTDTLHFKVKVPDSTNLTQADKANNSFAGFPGNNTGGAFEAVANTIVPAKYSIKGKVYYDMNPSNGIFNTDDGDVVAATREVKLYDAGGNVLATANTDIDGNYEFNSISVRGNYTIRITPSTGDTLSNVAVPSSSTVIGNDFTDETFGGGNVFKYTVNLTPEANNRTANAALKAIDSTLRVKYQDQAGAPLTDNAGTAVADVVTTHTFMAAYNVTVPADPSNTGNYEYVELHATSKPLTGTLSPGENVVILVYKKKDMGDVIVHHYEQGTGNSLAADENLSGVGMAGATYNTTPATITDYEVVNPTPTDYTGTYPAHGTTKVVTYEYKRKDVGDVIVKYVEQGSGTQLHSPNTLSGAGKSGLTYTTVPEVIANYTVVNATPTDHTGTYPAAGTTKVVTYEYKRDDGGNVIVHHYEQGTTTQLVPDMTLLGAGKLGLAYTTNEHNIPDFTLVAQPANKNGVYTTGIQTVTYEYKRNDVGNVIVHHYENGTTNEVSPDETLSGIGKSGLTYTTAALNLANFTVVNATPANHTGVYPASGNTVVTYYYTRNDAGDVLVHHYEAGTTTSLAADENLPGAGKSGLTYTTAPVTIANYTVVNATPTDHTGVYPASGVRTVTYEYRRDDAGDVTVRYVDDEGNEIDNSDILSGVGKLGLPYTTTAKNIPNFILITVPANATGTFVTGTQTVTYVYRRDDAGNVTVYHKSVYDGSDLTAPNVMDGTRKLGLPYTTNPETYADFEVDTVPSNANGTFASGAQTVTYLYKRKISGGVTINYLDNHGNNIESTDTITGTDNVGLPYTTLPKTIQYYDLITVPSNANGLFTVAPITVDYIYKRQDAGNVIVEHIDENGNIPLDTPEILDGNEKLGLPYTSSAKSFDNFDLIITPANANGTFISGSQTVTYVYRRKDAGDVIAHYVNTAGLPIESDEVLDGTRSLGLPYSTTQKDIEGYHLYLVQGRATGIFTTGQTVVTYIYQKDPSQVIIPGPLTPVTPVTPSIITPGTSTTPTPSRIATPSQILIPNDRNRDITIRPIATPSIATPSNISRGGSGGGSSDRLVKTRTVNTVTSKDAINTTVEKQEKTPTIKEPEKVPMIPAQREALPVPKTADTMDISKYMFILISSIIATIVIVKKKKETR